MNVRQRRLQSDYDKMLETFRGDGRILIKEIAGNPPEKYQIEFLINSLIMKPNGAITVKNNHIAEIYLTASYPRQPPQCRMLTPVFHPNIAPHAICVGDHWAAGESLSHLIVRIGEMLSYQSYNLKSPLNGEAAKWADKNRSRFPIDKMDFSVYYEAGEATISESQVRSINENSVMICANCKTEAHGNQIVVCSSNHPVCSNCAMKCSVCSRQICLKCLTSTCFACKQIICAHCQAKCKSCGVYLCLNHVQKCYICDSSDCEDCTIVCALCGQFSCLDHIKLNAKTNTYMCNKCIVKPGEI